MTYAKSEQESAPTCISLVSSINIPKKFIEKLNEEGYTHYLRLHGQKRITVGDLMHEWRLLAMLLFSRETGELKELLTEQINKIPVVVVRKHYSEMQGCGHSCLFGYFTRKEAKEWIDFFELNPGKWEITAGLLLHLSR